MCNRVRAVVIKAKPIDQCSLLGETKDPRLWISRLCLSRHRADLDETKTQGGPRRQRQPVLVQAGGQADWIWEIEAKEFFGVRFRLKGFQPTQNRIRPRRGPQTGNGEMMRRFGIDRKQERPNESLITVFHLPMQN